MPRSSGAVPSSPRLYFSAFLTSKRNPGIRGRIGRIELPLPGVDEVLRGHRTRVGSVRPALLSGRMLKVQTVASSFGVNVSAQSGMALRSASKVRRPAAI